MTVAYVLEPDLNPAEFTDVLIRSSLAERRPVDRPDAIRAMLEHADIIVTARVGAQLVGVSRAISDFSYCTARMWGKPCRACPAGLTRPALRKSTNACR